MLTDSTITALHSSTEGMETAIPATSLLFAVARDFITMVHAYRNDTCHFIRTDDNMNGLASAAYALGWFDAGENLGLIQGRKCKKPDLFVRSPPASPSGRMEEKTLRYERLLALAIQGVVPAPEPGTPPDEIASRFLVIAGVYLQYGRLFLREHAMPNALFCFSYGFAWLDAGIRAGIFRITGDRNLFAH